MDTGSQPVARGKTWYGQTATIDTSDYGTSTGIEGYPAVFPDTDPADTTLRRSGGEVKAILVRNVSGITLFKCMAVVWSVRGKRVNGYVTTTAAEYAGIVDDHLGSAGVRNGDMFWLIVGGPVLRYTPIATPTCSAGDVLYAKTAANSTGNTTAGTTANEAGRLLPWNGTFTAAETTDGSAGNILLHSYARAISGVTSAETNSLKLVELRGLAL